MAGVLKDRIQILILLLYTATDPHGKAALVEKSKKIVGERLAITKN
jgi:hypothetical protein